MMPITKVDVLVVGACALVLWLGVLADDALRDRDHALWAARVLPQTEPEREEAS